MKVYGQLERAQAELLAADPTGAGLINGRFYYNTVTNKLSFYDGAVRQVVSEDGTATLTNKTLTGNIAANLSPDGVETLTLPALTDTVAVLASAQTLENKSLPTINFPHQATPATPASGNSKLYVKSDRKAYLLDEEGNEIAIGTGGGGLDIFYTQDFSVDNAADMTTGNNATFLGGGSIAGTLANFSDSLGNRRLRYTQAAGSLNDYFAGPAFDVPEKARGNKTGVKFVYKYNGNDDEIKPEVYDVTNGTSLISDTVLIKAFGNLKVFEVFVDIPLTCASLRWGFQVKTLNSGAILEVDDIQFNADALASAEVYASSEVQNYSPNWTGFGTVSNNNAVYWREGSHLRIVGWVNAGTTTGADASFSLPTGLNVDFNKVPDNTAQRNYVGRGIRNEAGQNPSLQEFSLHVIQNQDSDKVYFASTPVNDGEFNRNGGGIMASGDGLAFDVTIPIEGWSNVERGVSVRGTENNLANENEFSVVVNNNGTVTKLSESSEGFFTLTRVSQGVVRVDLPSGVFVNELPHITATVSAQSGTTFTGTRSVEYYDVTNNQFFIATKFCDAVGNNQNFIDYNFTIKVTKQGTDYIKDTERTVVLPNGLQNPVAIIKDIKGNGVEGGTFATGPWQTRDLNFLAHIGGDFATLSSNQFTLPPGSYEFESSAPAFDVGSHKTKLRDVTNGANFIIGSNEYSQPNAGAQDQTSSTIKDFFTITETTTFELQHLCQVTSGSTNGFGVSNNFGASEVYTQIKITKRS